MRRLLVLLVVIAQIGVVAYMAVERELVVHTGTRVYLKTAPRDPRDLFRGDYVRLEYEITWARPEQMRGQLAQRLDEKGLVVYAALSTAEEGLAVLDYVSDQRPDDALFLQGSLTSGRGASSRARAVRIKYGIEQMFVEQWTGLDIERKQGTRDGLQIPLEVEVAVAQSGKSVLTGFKWSSLGVQLEMLRTPTTRGSDAVEPSTPLSPKVRITLQNVSDTPLQLAVPAHDCAFELQSAGWSDDRYEPVYEGCAQMRMGTFDLVALDPGEQHHTDIDLSDERWYVKTGEKVAEIGALDAFARFRFIYRAPLARESVESMESVPVWQGHIQTRAFNATGRID